MNHKESMSIKESQVSSGRPQSEAASFTESIVERCEFESLLQRAMEIMNARARAATSASS